MWSHRLGEEALDLAGVQVHRQHAVDPRGLEHARDEAGGDRLARRRLLVLARVAVPRRHGDHAVRRGADRRVDHHQQLHQRVVGGDPGARVAARRLDDEDVGAADRLLVAAVDLAVGERLERRPPPRSTPSLLAILAASSGFARPENSISRLS